MSVALSACSSAADSDPATRNLTVLLPSEPPSINAVKQSQTAVRYVERAVVETVVAKDADGAPDLGGALVTSIEPKPGESGVFRLAVRPGVRFQNDAPLTADDVAYSINLSATTSSEKSFYQDLGEAKAVDPATVELPVKNNLTADGALGRLSQVSLVPKAYYEQVGADGFGEKPVGTGAFRFVEWQKGVRIVVQRFDGYWGAPAAVPGVEFRFNADGAGRKAQVENGDADMTVALSPQLLTAVSDTTRVETKPSFVQMNWTFNAKTAPVDDVRIRQAISLAVDPKPITDALLDGKATPTFAIMDPQFSDFDHVRPHDVERAKALVAEVKAEKGTIPPVPVSYYSGRYPADTEIGAAVAGQIQEIGLDVEQRPMPVASYIQDLVGMKMPGLFMTTSPSSFQAPELHMYVELTSNGTLPYCADPQGDAYLAQARAATSEDERKKIFGDVERWHLTERVCEIPFDRLVDNYLVSTSIDGFVPRFDQAIDYKALSLTSAGA